MQYSMLPKRRAGITELWERMNAASQAEKKQTKVSVWNRKLNGVPSGLGGRRVYGNGYPGGGGALGRVRSREIDN
jgi:hypothetical protein